MILCYFLAPDVMGPCLDPSLLSCCQVTPGKAERSTLENVPGVYMPELPRLGFCTALRMSLVSRVCNLACGSLSASLLSFFLDGSVSFALFLFLLHSSQWARGLPGTLYRMKRLRT